MSYQDKTSQFIKSTILPIQQHENRLTVGAAKDGTYERLIFEISFISALAS